MPSGSWKNKGVSIQSSELTDAGYAYQSLYQPVDKTFQNHQHLRQEQQQQHRDGFSLESHCFMDLSRVLKEVEDEGSLIPSPTRLAERKRRLSNDGNSPIEDHDGYMSHSSIEQLKNTYSISLDSLNENNVEVSCRIPQENCRIDYDSDKTPTVDKSFWSESDDDSPVIEGDDSCYFDDLEVNSYHLDTDSYGRAIQTPTNLNNYLPPCDEDFEKEIRNIGVVTEDFDVNHELSEDDIDDPRSCSSHDATSSASSESLRSAYSLQTPALSSSPESYEMLYRSFEVAAALDKERKKNGVDICDSEEETLLDILNKASPKLQRMNYHRGMQDGAEETSSHESSPTLLEPRSSGMGAEAACRDEREASDDLRPFTLNFPSVKAHSAEDLSSSKVITFAQIAQQRKKPEPKQIKKKTDYDQGSLLHWTELLSLKGSSASQDVNRTGAQCDGNDQLPDAPRRPQSLPIQLRHLQKPTIRLHATPPKPPIGVTRTLSAPEAYNTTQRTGRSWGEHDEGIGELSESEGEDITPDPMNGPSSAAPPPLSLTHLLRQDELEFGSLTPRRHRTTTWCGSFGASRPSMLSSREHLSDTDSLDSWQPPQPTDINANVSSRRRSPIETETGMSALYDARSRPLNTSLCRKNFLSSRENVQRSRKRHYCKDNYAERMLQHGGVFISGTENKPFLLQNVDSQGGVMASNAKTRSLPRNLGVARRRGSTSGRSRPKSMEGLSSFSTAFDAGTLSSWTQDFAPLNRSKSTEEQLVPQSATDLCVASGAPSMQEQWEASDAADYASLNSCLLEKSPVKQQTRVTYEDVKSSSDESSIFPSSRRIVRIDNVAKDAEVKYIKHRPLKPIHVVDAEHHRKKVLERLSVLQPPSSAPPTGTQPQDWQSFSHPTTATSLTTSQQVKGHRRQKSDAAALASQSQTRREGFWAWATGTTGTRPARAHSMNSADNVAVTSGQQDGRMAQMRSQIRPLALTVAHEDWDTLESMPPQVMKVSPRTEAESYGIDLVQKKALVAEVNAAVAQLLAHFAQARAGQPEEKARLGNTWQSPDIGHLTLHYLCPALMRILQDGLRPHSNSLLVGRIKNTTWTVIEASTQLGPGTRLLHELASAVSKDSRLKDSKLRTHAFFLGLLNIRCMETWFDHIKTHPEAIRRLYEPTAFLSLCHTAACSQLFSDLLLAVQPLAQLPFNLDHGFEYGYVQEEKMRQRERRQLLEQHRDEGTLSSLNTNNLVEARHQTEGGRESSGFPSVHLFGRAPRRDGAPTQRPVSTGMYSSMTVRRNNRRVTPVGSQESSEQPATQGGLLRTVNSNPLENVAGHELERGDSPSRAGPQNAPSNRWSLGWIKEFATSVSAQSDRVQPTTGHSNTNYDVGSEYRRSKSVDMQAPVQGLGNAVASGWGKIGASFSRMWSQVKQPQPAPQPPTPRATPIRRVPSTPPPTPSTEQEKEEEEEEEEPVMEEVRHGGDGASPKEYLSPTAHKQCPGSPVKALCHHLSTTKGELCFSKGDLLTIHRQVDQNWLLCSHGNQTGLVHIEYVQGLE